MEAFWEQFTSCFKLPLLYVKLRDFLVLIVTSNFLRPMLRLPNFHFQLDDFLFHFQFLILASNFIF